ncbi:hypothetical protein [Rhizobium sp. RAF56]|uniref:hypothetical protein n=1 Tax=Rhizobium sp. RAF56 TaxID=3233062 RepID=UPI003F9B8776
MIADAVSAQIDAILNILETGFPKPNSLPCTPMPTAAMGLSPIRISADRPISDVAVIVALPPIQHKVCHG